MTAAPQAPVVCILDSGTNEAGAEGWNNLAGNEDLTDEAGHGDLIYQLLESETPNARLIMLKCFESAEETEEKKGTETITQALYDAVDLWQADVISISWTRNEESEELYEAVCYARENGAVLVAAAGGDSVRHIGGENRVSRRLFGAAATAGLLFGGFHDAGSFHKPLGGIFCFQQEYTTPYPTNQVGI